MSDQQEDVPELLIADRDESILDLLRDLQHAALVHSEAARALYDSLVSEGKMFAQTAEGKRWQGRLERSALLERALLVWQSATLWMTEDSGNGTTPSAVIDAVAAAARSPHRDELLDRLFRDLDEGG